MASRNTPGLPRQGKGTVSMLTKEEFDALLRQGPLLLDGATGSNLQKMGMPRGCCTEQWVLAHPEALRDLQSRYARAGSKILYAPTFQAQPIALDRVGLKSQCGAINACLVALTRSAAPQCLVAGNLTTLAAYLETWNSDCFDTMVENYRVQIAALMEGGADLLAAETLVCPQDAEAIFTAAELEGASCVLYSFTMQQDGSLFSGMEAGPVLRELEQAGAAAVGFNCVSANRFTPGLVSKLRRFVRGHLVCKPNAGDPVIGEDGLARYNLGPDAFAQILSDCHEMGADILGGCCGTDPDFLEAISRGFA